MGAPPPENDDLVVQIATFRVGDEELAVVSYPVVPDLPAALSPSEREVAALVMEGLSNQEIAQVRGTSERTVANQVASIFRRCGVSSRSELVAALVVA